MKSQKTGKGTKAGRKPNFDTKLLSGLSTEEILTAATFGSNAVSEGGKLASRYTYALQCGARDDAEIFKDFADRTKKAVMDKLDAELSAGRPRIFSEIAAYFQSIEQTQDRGSVSEGLRRAAAFVLFCQRPANIPFVTAGPHLPTLEKARLKCPFKPSPTELHEYLCEYDRNGDGPDRKTSDSYAKVLGLPFNPKRKKRR